MRTMLPIVLLVALIAILTSCRPTTKEVLTYATPPVESTPLNHDPTEAFEIGRWWTNGIQLLRLDEERSFALFNTLNRYQPPQERGVWYQQSYAVMWLEPYSLLPHDPVRVAIKRIEGDIAIVIPKLAPMSPIEAPPVVVEDGLLGAWQAPYGSLIIRENRSYSFSPDSSDADANVPLVGHSGRWRLDGDQLLLRPDALAMRQMRLSLVVEEDDMRLESGEGAFTPIVDDSRVN